MMHAVFQWGWTGFFGKTLWDWLQLLIIPVLLAIAGAWFTKKQTQESDIENKDNQRETALQSYIDNISELLLHEKLQQSTENNAELEEVRKIARVRTLTVLPRLDGARKRYVLQFLYDAGLIQAKSSKGNGIHDGPIVSLREASFSGVNLDGVNFRGVDLSETDLSKTDLRGADLREANLSETDLSETKLRGADLSDAKLAGTVLAKADLSGFKFGRFRSMILNLAVHRTSDNLSDDWSTQYLGIYGAKTVDRVKARIKGANLSDTDLRGANLIKAHLFRANLSGANFDGATLVGADLKSTDLRGADLRGTILSGADFRGADFRGATATGVNFNSTDLRGADLSDTEGVGFLSHSKTKGAITPDKSLKSLLQPASVWPSPSPYEIPPYLPPPPRRGYHINFRERYAEKIYAKNRAALKKDPTAFASRLTLLHTLKGHHEAVTCVVISHNTKIIVSGSHDKTIKIWSTLDGILLRTLTFAEGINEVALSQDSRTIASGGLETIGVWNTLDSKLLHTLKKGSKKNQSVSEKYHVALALHQDGHTIASGNSNTIFEFWNTLDGTLLHTLTFAQSHTMVHCVTFSWNGRIIVEGCTTFTGSGEIEAIKVWNALNGTLLHTLEGHRSWVTSIATSQDGRIIVSGGGDKMVKVWNALNGTLLYTLEGHRSWVRSLAISQNGRIIVSGSDDKTVKVWNALNGTLLRTLEGYRSSVTSVAVSQDGCIIVGSDDKTVKVWGVHVSATNLWQNPMMPLSAGNLP